MAKIVEQFHKVMHISIEQNHVLDALSGRELLCNQDLLGVGVKFAITIKVTLKK